MQRLAETCSFTIETTEDAAMCANLYTHPTIKSMPAVALNRRVKAIWIDDRKQRQESAAKTGVYQGNAIVIRAGAK